MTLEIQDKNGFYMHKETKWVRISNGKLNISYIGDDGEQRVESGPIPEYMRIMDCE